MSNPLLRIILCGKTTSIGKSVIEGLKPEVEVVRFITSLEEARRDIPLILSGRYNPSTTAKSDKDDEVLGTQNFKQIPDGVMLGGGYSKSDYEQIHQSYLRAPNIKKVPFFLVDTTKAAPHKYSEYGQAILLRAKGTLIDWQKDPLKSRRDNPIWF